MTLLQSKGIIMSKRPIYYDTETTGIKPNEDRIIEIAAYDPEQDRSFHSLINPGRPIPAKATEIHHITDEMVQDAPDFKTIGKLFIEFCNDDVVLIAHNNDAFDQLFLESECNNNNLKIPKWSYIDSLKFARKYRPDLPRYSLQYLREYHGISPNEAHRALDDVMILKEVFSCMIDDLTMEMILELMNEQTSIRHMPFGKHKGKPLEEVPKHYIRWLNENGALDKQDNKELKESFIHLGLLE